MDFAKLFVIKGSVQVTTNYLQDTLRKQLSNRTEQARRDLLHKSTNNIAQCSIHYHILTFCSLAVTKLAHWAMSSLLSCGTMADSLLQLSSVLALL